MNTCGEILRRNGTVTPALPAVRFGDRELSYRLLFERACRLVNALHALGVRAQERVALLGPNSLRSVEEISALALGGFVRVPLHYSNTRENHIFMLRDSEASVLIADHGSIAELRPLLDQVPTLRHVISDDPAADLSYEDLLFSASPEDLGWEVSGDDMIQIGYTGGTTGRAKGTVQTHRSWLGVAMENLAVLPPLDENDRYLAATALSAVGGSFVFPALARYLPIVVMPTFDANMALRLIEEQRASLTVMLPGMVQALVDEPAANETDLSSLRAVYVASTHMTERTIREVTTRLGDVLLYGYGQSESAPATMLTSADMRRGLDGDSHLLQSVGRPLPRARVQIIDSLGRTQALGSVGEIVIDTVGAMREYWKDPKETTEKFTPNGFVRTGDAGRLDEHGYLHVLGRTNETINAAQTIYPAEVENLLSENPAVKEIAVVGVPSDDNRDRALAVLHLRLGSDADDVLTWCFKVLADHSLQVDVTISEDSLPKSAAGKILRRVVRERQCVV